MNTNYIICIASYLQFEKSFEDVLIVQSKAERMSLQESTILIIGLKSTNKCSASQHMLYLSFVRLHNVVCNLLLLGVEYSVY